MVSLNCLLIVLGEELFLYALSSCLPADHEHLVRGDVLLLLHRAVRPADLDPIRPGLLLPSGRGLKGGGPGGWHEQRHLSASYQEILGTVYLSLHPSSMTLSEALIHELSHNKLNALFEIDVHRSMVADLTQRLFHGDFTALVSHLLSEQEIDARELERLKTLIAEKGRKEKRRAR